ncbi:MAG: hypothetical protein RL059_410 [Bacteroidota bacterium]|jgi:hypothetical protein
MNREVFNQVIEDFNSGHVNFNLGYNWSFLFDQKWYPCRRFLIEYEQILEVNRNINLHQSVFELSKWFPVVTSEIEFLDHFPVRI